MEKMSQTRKQDQHDTLDNRNTQEKSQQNSCKSNNYLVNPDICKYLYISDYQVAHLHGSLSLLTQQNLLPSIKKRNE